MLSAGNSDPGQVGAAVARKPVPRGDLNVPMALFILAWKLLLVVFDMSSQIHAVMQNA